MTNVFLRSIFLSVLSKMTPKGTTALYKDKKRTAVTAVPKKTKIL